MPDPSDSTAPIPKASEGPAPEAAAGKPGSAAPPAEPLSLVPRTRSGSVGAKESAVPTGPEGAPASFTDLMQWMKMFAAASTAPPEEAPKPGNRLQRTTLPREQRKFQRFDRDPGTPEAAATPAQPAPGAAPENRGGDDRSAAPADDEKVSSPAAPPVPIALTGGTSGRRLKSAAARRPRLWLVLELGALVLLAGAFLLGRASVGKVAPPAGAEAGAVGGAPTVTLDPAAARMIDEAMAAEQDGNPGKATELLLKVQKNFPKVRDVDYRLATLALEQGDSAKALILLNAAIAKGEQAAAAYRLRGSILNRKGGMGKRGVGRGMGGMNDFESATLLDPFSADNYYYWGEALRHAGKPQAALVKLQQAMDRLREPEQDLEPGYRLKIRLALIELGRENEFAPELAAMLAANPPPPDWLLTAAAIDLQHHDLAGAAGYLERASQLMDKDLFELRMHDYFFFSYRFEKPLAKYFAFAATAPPAADKAATSGPDASTPPSGTP